MRNGTIKVLGLGGLVASTVLGLGCMAGEATPDKGSSLPQGISVLEATETSISVAFREKNAAVFMQAKRGRPTAEIYQKDSKSPKFEIDARFMDAHGFIFYIQQGGDGWIDPSWGEDLKRQMRMERPLSGSNEVLFRLATDVAKTLRHDLAVQIGNNAFTKLAPVVDSIVLSASNLHVQYREQFKLREQALLKEGLPAIPRIDRAAEEITYGTPGPDDAYFKYGSAASYSIDLHSDKLDGIPGYAGGYHSATDRHAWSGGAIYWTHSTCNHGSCGATMTKRSGSGYKSFAAGELYALHCSGEYKWDSDGGSRGHNCHDDSRIQMHNFQYKSWMWGDKRWCDGGDNDHDISVDVFLVELDQDGYPEFSSSDNRGYGSSACQYTMGCNAGWMGAGDGCDCASDGTWCAADTDCGSKPATTTVEASAPASAPASQPKSCQYTMGCYAGWMGVGDGCDCNSDGTLCPDSDCY